MAQQRPAANFDLSKFSTATKILVGAGLVGLINSFIPWWQRVSLCGGIKVPGVPCSVSASALGGDASWAGVLMFIGFIALVVWEGANAMGALSSVNLPVAASRISVYIAGWVLLWGLLKFLLALSHVFIGAFIGLICLIAVGYGAYMRWQEPAPVGGTTPPAGGPPPPTGGGFTT
jgi:hypothetical protein